MEKIAIKRLNLTRIVELMRFGEGYSQGFTFSPEADNRHSKYTSTAVKFYVWYNGYRHIKWNQ